MYSDRVFCGDWTGTPLPVNPVVRKLDPYPIVSPPGATRYALTWLAGSLASATSTSMLRSMTGRLSGTTNE